MDLLKKIRKSFESSTTIYVMKPDVRGYDIISVLRVPIYTMTMLLSIGFLIYSLSKIGDIEAISVLMSSSPMLRITLRLIAVIFFIIHVVVVCRIAFPVPVDIKNDVVDKNFDQSDNEFYNE
uniref:Neur_chan_memb domain-containing protein n=1 Tax=Panagrellus redivivus TaxID=6233 RepID=A0A7E4VJX1_PANRE